MFGNLFKPTLTGDGYDARWQGRNTVCLKKAGRQFFVFIEPLVTTPLSVQMDLSGVWLDKSFAAKLSDKALRDEVLRNAREYLESRRIGVET